MEYIKKEELIIGEVYTHKNGNICRCDQITNMYIIGKHLGNNRNEFRQPPKNPGNFLINHMRLATSEEKHWLNCCITANKFITFEEAMKTLIPEIEPLPQFKVIESIETITKVENNEGNQFFIGDVVISDSGFVQTIKSFRYNVNKDNVLATTNVCNQISIARLEHYIEPKVKAEETLLEKAKRLYPVGTKFINPNDNRECVIKEKGNYFEGNNNNIYHSIANTAFKYEEGLSGCIYMNNTWSKIIE